jgi:hypothetical protein
MPYRRFHGASSASVRIATVLLENGNFVEQFKVKSRNGLAKSYKLVTSVLDKKGISYVKGGQVYLFLICPITNFVFLISIGIGTPAFLCTSTYRLISHPMQT